MKLRLTEDCVRLRFRRSEVEALASTGEVSVNVDFPGGSTLTYRSVAAPVGNLSVTFEGNAVEIQVPRKLAAAWPASSDVGIYGEHDGLQVVLEKDFRRSSAPSPDDDDRYPNPRALAREAAEGR